MDHQRHRDRRRRHQLPAQWPHGVLPQQPDDAEPVHRPQPHHSHRSQPRDRDERHDHQPAADRRGPRLGRQCLVLQPGRHRHRRDRRDRCRRAGADQPRSGARCGRQFRHCGRIVHPGSGSVGHQLCPGRSRRADPADPRKQLCRDGRADHPAEWWRHRQRHRRLCRGRGSDADLRRRIVRYPGHHRHQWRCRCRECRHRAQWQHHGSGEQRCRRQSSHLHGRDPQEQRDHHGDRRGQHAGLRHCRSRRCAGQFDHPVVGLQRFG